MENVIKELVAEFKDKRKALSIVNSENSNLSINAMLRREQEAIDEITKMQAKLKRAFLEILMAQGLSESQARVFMEGKW